MTVGVTSRISLNFPVSPGRSNYPSFFLCQSHRPDTWIVQRTSRVIFRLLRRVTMVNLSWIWTLCSIRALQRPPHRWWSLCSVGTVARWPRPIKPQSTVDHPLSTPLIPPATCLRILVDALPAFCSLHLRPYSPISIKLTIHRHRDPPHRHGPSQSTEKSRLASMKPPNRL